MENKGISAAHLVLATLGGAAAGAAVALLLAPKSGRETRQQLNGYIEATKDKVSRMPEAIRTAGHAAQETMSKAPPVAKPERNGSPAQHA